MINPFKKKFPALIWTISLPLPLPFASLAGEPDPALQAPLQSIKTPQDALNATGIAGTLLVTRKLQDAHTIQGQCQLLTSETDRFPVPCENVMLSLKGQVDGKEDLKEIQTSHGKFRVSNARARSYQLSVNSPRFRLASPAAVTVSPGSEVVITVIRQK